MALGKKKNKKNRDVAVKEQLVQMNQNPLYPEKQESTAKEVLAALGTAVICLIFVGIITVNYSYSFGNVQAYGDTVTYNEQSEDAVAEAENDMDMEEIHELMEEDTGIDAGALIEEEEELEEEIYEDSDYIIPDSHSRYISESELHELTKEELSYARNEIYARHGRRFKDEGLQAYFDSKEWYEGTISPEDFRESMLNDYEIKNAETILSYEKEKGYR